MFIPTFIMQEPIRSLFMPLTLAVGFSMITSYVLSSTLVPVLATWLLKHRGHAVRRKTLFDHVLRPFGRVVWRIALARWITVPAYLAGCGLILWFVGRELGNELFPQVNSGQFVIRFRAPPGSQYELTRRTAVKILDVIDKAARGKVAISMGYVGLAATNTATNNMLLLMRASDDGQLRVRLLEDSGIALAGLRQRLREVVPEEVVPWLKEVLQKNGLTAEQAASQAKLFEMSFEPGDIVSEVMSLGSPMPVEVVVAGPHREDVRAHALKILAGMKEIPTLRDVQLYQQLDYPTVRVDIDRQRAGMSGVTVKNVTDSFLVGTSSSRYVTKNYWLDSSHGVDYQVQVQVPGPRMDRPEQIETLPLVKVNPDSNLLIRDVASVHPGTAPGQVDRTSMQRYLSVVANVEGEDLGRASHRIEQAIADAGRRRGECASCSADRSPQCTRCSGRWPSGWRSRCW